MFDFMGRFTVSDKKTWWRFYREYLTGLACCMEPGTVEYKNLFKRAAWINENRL